MDTPLERSGLGTKVFAEIHPERKIQVLESQYETLYRSINKLAATITNTPVAMINFYNDQHIWVEPGDNYPEIMQYIHQDFFHNWAITNSEYIEISDTSVISSHGPPSLNTYYTNFKFYAGVPLKLPLGEVIGVLSVFDTKLNCMNPQQKSMLIALADVTTKSLIFKNHFIRS